MKDQLTAAERIIEAADDIPNHEWLHLLADAMEEDINGIAPLMTNGYMSDRVRRIAGELLRTHQRLDEAIAAAVEIQDMAEDMEGDRE